MRVDAGEYLSSVLQAGDDAAAAEAAGLDGWWGIETVADVFLACSLAAQRTERIDIGTAIAVAFARNPMTVAMQANDLHLLSGGRFHLGLGAQIKAHIQRRFSMEYSRPAARMREFVLAIRAIWDTFASNAPLDFEGEFYRHTLMAPFFNPGPNPHGNPKILVAGVGPLMTEVAGEVADGLLCHAFSTERYVREVTVPALLRGRQKAGKPGLEGFEVSAPALIVARDTEEEIAQGLAAVKQQIGFYGSTPAYRPVLELHGWGDLGSQLTTLSKEGRWDEMPGLVDDEVVEAFAVVGTPEDAIAEFKRRYGDIATRVNFQLPEDADPERWGPVMAQLRA